ncbi:MAG: hypothetical protein LBL21_01500 [Rickettsiales bacterium]|nr:hypothetical protein [Rickettsiales bacterium]
MKAIYFLVAAMLAACAFPRTPSDGDLLRATRNFQPELFASGARGEIIVKMHDDLTDDSGWFGRKYTNIFMYKNASSGETGYLEMHPKDEDDEYAAAMLPIGDYEVSDLKLRYVYTTTTQTGNMRTITTHVEEYSGFAGNDKLTFNVGAGKVLYIGDIELHKGDNSVSEDDRTINTNSYKISDKSAEIPADKKDAWEKEFGKPIVSGLISVRKGAKPKIAAQKIGEVPNSKGK